MSKKQFRSQASSSRAVSGAFAASDGVLGPFDGGGFGGVSSSPLSYVYEPPDMSTISEPNIVVAFKNVQKKDSTTKAKALEDLLQYSTALEKANGVENAVLDAWIKVYPRTSIDTARRVRQLAHQLQGTIAHKSGKAFAKCMPDVVGAWLAGLFDGDKMVSRTAHSSFKEVFQSEEKINNVWTVYLGSILQYCSDAVFKETVYTLSDERTVSPDDAAAKYARVVAAAVLVVRYVLEISSSKAVGKEHDAVHDFLGRKELWKFAAHSDASVRRAIYRLLDTMTVKDLEKQDLEIISSCIITSSLSIDQTASALDYVRALVRLTQNFPTVWTDHYKGTGKKAATKRLCQFLSKGSQGSASRYWDEVKKLLLNVPISVLLPPHDASDHKYATIEALREGISNREEPRSSQHAAWKAYLELVQRSLLEPQGDRDELVRDTVLPIVTQYITLSRETQGWTVSNSQPSIVEDAAIIASNSPQIFIDHWRTLSNAIVQDLQTSLPEQSKDYAKSQDSISAKANRWYDLQARLSRREIVDDVRLVMKDASIMEVQSAIALLKARNGKPYGAASTMEIAIRLQPDLISAGQQIRDSLRRFMADDFPDLLLSPAGPYLIDLLPQLKGIIDENAVYRKSLNATLQAPDTPARPNTLRKLMVSPCLASLENDSELLAGVATTLKQLMIKGPPNEDIFHKAISNPQAPSRLIQDLLAQLFDDLSLDEQQSTSLKGIETLIKHNDNAVKAYDAASNRSALLAKLIALGDSGDEVVSLRAKTISDLLQSHSSADHAQDDQKILEILRHGLDTMDPNALSVTLLVDLAKKTFQGCSEQDKSTMASQILPDERRWTEALRPILTTRPKPSLAITNPLGNSLALVEPPTPFETTFHNKDGHSTAFRMLWFTIALIKTSDIFGYATADRRNCIIREVAIILQIASDNLSIRSSNLLWGDQDMEAEEDIIDIVTQAQALLASWISGTPATVLPSDVSSTLMDDSHGLSVSSYYSSRAYVSLLTEMTEAHVQPDTEQKLDLAKVAKNAADIMTAVATVLTVQDTTAVTRTFNELLAGLTGTELNKEMKEHDAIHKVILLNSILSRDDFGDVLPGIPKQRLVFFVQHVCKQLIESPEDNPPSILQAPLTKSARVLTAEIMKVINHLLPALSELYGSFWEDLAAILPKTWSFDKESPEEILPSLHAGLRLYSTLRPMAVGNSNDDLVDALKSHEESLSSGLMHLLYAFQRLPDESHQPQKIVNELLARQISSIKGPLDVSANSELFPALGSESSALQGAAYQLLHRQVPKMQEDVSMEKALSKDYIAKLPDELLSLILEAPTLDSLAEESFSKSLPASLRTYLLSWQLIFDHWNGSSDAVKNDYVNTIKEGSYIDGLLSLAADFLISSRARPVDASKFDIESHALGSEDLPEKDAQGLLIHLYYLSLRNLPTLSKTWWRDHTSRQTQISLESWTEKHISPLIIAAELATVSAWAATAASNPDDNNNNNDKDHPMTVKTSPSTREITATIPIDDQSTLALGVHLPPAYPLARATVASLHRVGVSEHKWQSWLRTTQGIINFSDLGGGNQIVDGLAAWRRNVMGMMKGQSECAICYSVEFVPWWVFVPVVQE
ncbi:MAG: hypothetical protein L6R37_002310 [Teloschistes peruensis]|nr:MAG: hypothetical protein L6R37_002310 [Teloschistes peruensis]